MKIIRRSPNFNLNNYSSQKLEYFKNKSSQYEEKKHSKKNSQKNLENYKTSCYTNLTTFMIKYDNE